MKLLLIEPESHEKAPNLGLLYVSAALAQAGKDALLLDLNNGPRPQDPVERVVRLIDDHKVDLLGVSICDVNLEWCLDLIRRIKAERAVKVLAGGPHVNSLGKTILRDHPELDLAISGECETTTLTCLDVMEQGGSLKNIPGLIFRNGSVKEVPKAKLAPVDNLALPDYGHLGIAELPAYMLLTSRGCPYRCTFCCRNTGEVWRPRSLSSCMAELRRAKQRLGIQSFRIVDASFNIQEERVREFCRLLGEEGIELPWMVAGIRADRLTEASVRAMKQAGCEMVAVGVESIDPKVFPGINKGESISQILLALELCRRYGLEVGCYMVHGLPGDSYQRSIKYARKLQELDPDYIMYNHAIPFVGTELHSWVSRHGQFNPKFSWLNTRDFNSAAFWTDDFSHQQRLDSFRVIQTITHVVNFAGEDPGELDQLLEEVRLYDPDRLEYHRGYLERRLKQKGKAKNRFKKIHKENQFSHLPGYTGCVELASGRMV